MKNALNIAVIGIVLTACNNEQLMATGKNLAKNNCQKHYPDHGKSYFECLKNAEETHENK
jgi:hypothetical protein